MTLLNDLLDALPTPNPRRLALHVTPAAERALRQGHPWLFADAIIRQNAPGAAGDLAVIFNGQNRFMALGLYDPESPIRVKVLHHGSPTPLDASWFAARIAAAAARRAPLLANGTTGYRLIHGENDGLPSLIVDRYAETLVMKLYSPMWLPHLRYVLPALLAATAAERVVLRLGRHHPAAGSTLADGQVLYGPPLPDHAPLRFVENGLHFAADVLQGHKTGFFFDHRDNRQRVRELAAGRRVLDVFAYAGAFSVYAAAGGAQSILSVDISAPALAAAQHNFALNAALPSVAAAHHEVQVGDAFDLLEQMRRSKAAFDMVIVDPPTFTGSAEHVPRALEAYRRLVHLALPLVSRGGLFVMASCSSRVTPERFFDTLTQAAADDGVALEPIARTSHGIDHPVGFPEGAYLKCLFARRK